MSLTLWFGPNHRLLAFSFLGIFLAPTSMLGLKENVCCVKESYVRVAFSYSNLHDVTNSIIEIPKVRVQVPE